MSDQQIVRIVPKKMNKNQKRRTAGRMRAKGFSEKVISEQLRGTL